MTLYGVDGSHHQDGIVLTATDWDRVDFAIWRASIGRKTDRTFRTMMTAARTHAVPVAAYHFVYRTQRASTLSPYLAHPADVQAATLDAAVRDRTVPVMLDWEPDGFQHATFDDVLRVASALRGLGYRVPLLYTGRWWWQKQGAPKLTGYGFDLVNADYGADPKRVRADLLYAERGGPNGRGWKGYGGLDPVMWQFTSRCLWGDRYMDHNAIRDSDVAQLDRWFKTWTPPAAPIEEDPMLVAKTKEPVPEMGLGVDAFIAGDIVHGCAHISGTEAAEVFRQFRPVDAGTGQPVTSWSQVSHISAAMVRLMFGRRAS